MKGEIDLSRQAQEIAIEEIVRNRRILCLEAIPVEGIGKSIDEVSLTNKENSILQDRNAMQLLFLKIFG